MATEIAKAYVQILPSTKNIKGALTKEMNGEAAAAGRSSGESLGSSLVGGFKKLVVAAGIGSFVKSALDAGGALQQSFGGLDTIYGEASEAAKKYSEAAVTAGISMNDYAEQAVSFGASLKMAFAGDTTKAVEAANTAILDMADNAAKMGTPLESIQNAYQGFAKQNYTMLDNLKLGYGGTKTEMERLLADATKLSGVEYNIDNLGDVYEAIHVIQGDLGLTGVAADEAATTFTGSMGAMKAAAQNLLASLTTGGDITQSFNMLVGNARVFLTDNLLPMIGQLLQQIPTLFTMAMQQAIDAIKDLTANSKGIIDTAMNVITGLVNAFLENAPDLLEAGLTLLETVVDGIIDNLPKVLETALKVILALVEGLGKALPRLIAKIPEIVVAVVDTFLKADWGGLGRDILLGIKDGLVATGSALWDALKRICEDVFKRVKAYFKIGSPSKLMANEVGHWLPPGIAVGVEDNMKPLTDSIDDMVDVATLDGKISTIISGNISSAANSQSAFANDFDSLSRVENAIVSAMSKITVVMDTGATVGVLAPGMNNALGKLALRGSNR